MPDNSPTEKWRKYAKEPRKPVSMYFLDTDEAKAYMRRFGNTVRRTSSAQEYADFLAARAFVNSNNILSKHNTGGDSLKNMSRQQNEALYNSLIGSQIDESNIKVSSALGNVNYLTSDEKVDNVLFLNLAQLKVNILKEIFEFLGEGLDETSNLVNYKNKARNYDIEMESDNDSYSDLPGGPAGDTGVSDALLEFLKKTEDYRPNPYHVPGETFWTVGYGNRYNLDGSPVTNRVYSPEELDAMFRKAVKESADAVKKAFPNLNQNQIDALTSLTYNRGSKWLHQNGKLKEMIQENPNNPEIADVFRKTAVSYRGHVIRRNKEANWYFGIR